MSFQFYHLTDSHLYAAETQGMDIVDRADAFFRALVAEGVREGVDFILHTGDFVNSHGNLARHRRFKGLIDELSEQHGIPIHLVRGNHDCKLTDAEFESIYGAGIYWFAHRDWVFLCIDRYYRTYEHTLHAYCMSSEALDRVESLLEEIPAEKPMVVCLHDDPIGISRFHRGPELLARIRRTHNPKLLLSGHVQCSYVGGWNGIPFATVTGDDIAHDSSPLMANWVTCRTDGVVSCSFRPITVNLPTSECSAGNSKRESDAPRVRLGSDWPSLRGPSGTRATDDSLPAAAPRLAWQAKLEGRFGMGGPTLADGRLYVSTMTRGGVEECVAACLDAQTGRVLWQRPLDGSAEGGVLTQGGQGYVATSAGSLYRLDLAEGSVDWRWNNRDNMPIVCQPVAQAGLIHCGANWEMYAVEAESGEHRWRKVATPNGFTYMGPGNASPLVVGDRVFHQRPFNALPEGQALVQSVRWKDGSDRQLAREGSHLHPKWRHASPVFHEDRVYAVGAGLLVIDPSSPDCAESWWSHDPGSATPAVRDGKVCVSYHREIVAYDLRAGGAVLWRTTHLPTRYHFSGNSLSKYGGAEQPYGAFSAPLAAREHFLVCDGGGRIRALRAEDGTEEWCLTVDAPILAAPVLSGSTLFTLDYEGTISAWTW